MIREIGSEFNISWEIDNTINKSSSNIHKSYYDYAYARSGREAIGFILDEIKPKTKIAILPTYICESMLEPFLKRGYSIEYFGIDEYFNPNISELEIALHKNPDIILVIDWFGMDKNQEVVSLAKKYSENLTVLADCTHSYFNYVMSFEADFIVASLRKWFALPDGAIAINCKGNFKNRLEFIDNYFFAKRKKAMLMKTEYLYNGEEKLKVQFRSLLSEAEDLLDNEDRLIGMSPFSISVINEMDFDLMKKKRRENFNMLHNFIKGNMNTYITPIVNKMATDSECPFSFPIITEGNRDKLQSWLSNNGIYCPVLWPLPEDVYLNNKVSAYISDNMLSIPCDQRYSINDMKYIVKTIDAFFRGN